jgi:hypothetical protein
MDRKESRHHSTEEIVKAVTKARGLITVAARFLGCTPQAIRSRAKNEDEIRQAITNARDGFVDRAEEKLMAAVNKGQPWSISLVLKTLGKERGYVERGEITGANGEPLTRPDFSKLSIEELKQLRELTVKMSSEEAEDDADSA